MKGLIRRHPASLDIGGGKICCWLAQETDQSLPTLIGTGYVGSKGIGPGIITDIPILQEAIIAALYEAEQKSNTQVRQANITLSCGFFSPQYQTIETAVSGSEVTEHDIRALYEQIRHPHAEAIHIIPLGFCVDHQKNLRDPRGSIGHKLTARFHILWMDKGRLQTLKAALKRCQLEVKHIIAAPQANSLSCLFPDEQELGAAIIDFGAHITNISIFIKGLMVVCASIPMGAHTITKDIARGCDTPLLHAERVKILHGAALRLSHDHHETVPLIAMGEWDKTPGNPIPKSFLINIIQARCQEIFLHIKQEFEKTPYFSTIQRIVLTGGGSQLGGIKELAQRVFSKSVRIALLQKLPHSPKLFNTREEKIGGSNGIEPEFSAVLGALLYQRSNIEKIMTKKKHFSSLFSLLRKKM